jgi:hypothetical protein
MRNIWFFKDGKIHPHSHPDLEFVDCVSITFKHQKQEEKNDTVTQEANCNSVLCPIRFAAGNVRQNMSYPGTSLNTNILAYMSNGSVEHVTSRQVINALRNAVGAIGKAHLGISEDEIGTHSIRLGIAMAMCLGECPVYTIMLIGRWSSNAFLQYI